MVAMYIADRPIILSTFPLYSARLGSFWLEHFRQFIFKTWGITPVCYSYIITICQQIKFFKTDVVGFEVLLIYEFICLLCYVIYLLCYKFIYLLPC